MGKVRAGPPAPTLRRMRAPLHATLRLGDALVRGARQGAVAAPGCGILGAPAPAALRVQGMGTDAGPTDGRRRKKRWRRIRREGASCQSAMSGIEARGSARWAPPAAACVS